MAFDFQPSFRIRVLGCAHALSLSAFRVEPSFGIRVLRFAHVLALPASGSQPKFRIRVLGCALAPVLATSGDWLPLFRTHPPEHLHGSLCSLWTNYFDVETDHESQSLPHHM